MDYASAQRAYSEYALLVNCLGLPAGTWPESRQAFWSYWDDQVHQLTVSSDAAQFAKDLRESNDMPRWVQSLKPFLRVTTIEMLPPTLRDAYGLRSTVTTRALYRTWMGFSVALYPAMPDKWRAYPLKFEGSIVFPCRYIYTPSRNAFNCAIKQDSYSNCHDSFLLSVPHSDPSIPPRSLEISSTS